MSQAVILSKMEQEYLLRIVESAAGLRDLRQFFLWSQGQLQALLPHQLMVCMQFAPDGALQRLEAVHGSVLDDELLQSLCDRDTGLAIQLARHCSTSGNLPCMADLGDALPQRALAGFQHALAGCGFDNLLIDGTGPVNGGASVFLLFGLPMRPGPRHAYFLSLLLPQLHLALARLATTPPPARRGDASAGQRRLSRREAEVMHWLRAGKRNDEIAQILGLSALTVKNHLQRIYKVLGVRNRTEAVARSNALSALSGGQ